MKVSYDRKTNILSAAYLWLWIFWDQTFRSANSVRHHSIFATNSQNLKHFFPTLTDLYHERYVKAYTFTEPCMHLKRFCIHMDPRYLCVFLPRLFALTSFAPQLETLEIISFLWHDPELSKNLTRLDRGIQSHILLQRVVVTGITHQPGSEVLDKFKEVIKRCMPRCVERGMMEYGFRDALRIAA